MFLRPKEWQGQVTIWIDAQGKSALFDSEGEPSPPVARLLAGGVAVAGVDLFRQGEFLSDGGQVDQARLVGDARGGYAGYTFGYNASLFSKRVRDILSLVSYVRHHERQPETVSLVGLEGAGHWVAAAAAIAETSVDRVAIANGGFRFAALDHIDHPDFLPGAVKYGDLPGLISLSAPRPTWLAAEGGESLDYARQAYSAAGRSEELTHYEGPAEEATSAAVEWLLE